MKIAHISDVHFRSLKRHDEYKNVFNKVYSELNTLCPDIIFIGGDIVHSKIQGITPELIDIVSWFFESLSKIAETHVILGNHDGLILNEDRQDAISPIINALNNKRIKLYKKSGTYPLFKSEGIMKNLCVFSCFDQANWTNVKPVKGEVNIACFHGAVAGSKTDSDWELNGEVSLSFFDEFDFALLGDIHKFQYLDYEKRIAYPGSTIQQNYGEDIIKGFLFWDIKNRNDYKSKFIQIKNDNPFVTIDWNQNIEKTLLFIKNIKKGFRCRIRSENEISQSDIEILTSFLKKEKNVSEIVFKINSDSKTNVNLTNKKINNNLISITNKESRLNLLKDFFVNEDLEQINEINEIYEKYISQLNKEQNINSKNWSINKLEFSNTFSYGENNHINFDNLSGIVGIFGKNRAGKSSIPGTLMYSLFNASDRGAIKNTDIINYEKNNCNTKVTFTLDNEKYEVNRKSFKRKAKNGVITSKTDLTLNKISSEEIENETDEQRRETEKILRSLIGTSDDFLYTSFASQGHMNSFINEKSTTRKSILAKFLNLDLFDEINKIAKEENILIKSKAKNLIEKNWFSYIDQNNNTISENKKEIINLKQDLNKLKEIEIEKRVKIENLKKDDKQHYSGFDHDSIEEKLIYLKEKLENLKNNKHKIKEQIFNLNQKNEKINNFISTFPENDLLNEKERLEVLKEKLNIFNNSVDKLKTEIKNNNKKINILSEIPCNNKFKNCVFIKDANDCKDNADNLEKNLFNIIEEKNEINNIIKSIEKENINNKLEKLNKIKIKKTELYYELNNLKNNLDSIENEILSLKQDLIKYEKISNEINETIIINNSEKINELNESLEFIKNDIHKKENKIESLNYEIYELYKSNENLEKEKEEYNIINKKWELFNKFYTSTGKKGIPTLLINSFLPIINSEVNKILTNVVNFNVCIEDDDNNNLNIMIDYNGNKRNIETASGMEKMISSIALRVALTNISSLSKSDIFIIDEGFGALDQDNIDSCVRLLKSLKKYFKTILIISHVDFIKDIVEKNIIIENKKGFSYVNYK